MLKNKINDSALLMLALLYLIPVLISENVELNLLISLAAFVNVIILKPINYRFLLYLFLVLLIPLFSMFITVLIYTENASSSTIKFTIFNLPIYSLAWDNAIFLTSRTFALSFISFLFLLTIKYDKFVFSLMQHCKLSAAIGYSLLVTFNAFSYLKEEFIRIQQTYKMRFLKTKFPIFSIMPLLVSASRFAHKAGLSLECRGLNKEKTYLETQKWHKIDTLIIFLNVIEIFIILMLMGNKINIRLQ